MKRKTKPTEAQDIHESVPIEHCPQLFPAIIERHSLQAALLSGSTSSMACPPVRKPKPGTATSNIRVRVGGGRRCSGFLKVQPGIGRGYRQRTLASRTAIFAVFASGEPSWVAPANHAGVTKEQLEGAPTFAVTDSPAWGDRAYETRIHAYYKTVPFWAV
jgi:hypothetical protein